MKELRIGNERFKVRSTKKIEKLCPIEHPMVKVKTEKNGSFEYCNKCRLTKQVPDDDQ